ncbi:MAG: hypothetical protein JXQ75_23485 [Phycisphaerae bacterium]|nr:hypothetical protein [Phycisphaerae bacterium]
MKRSLQACRCLLSVIVIAILATGCMTVPKPTEVRVPSPIQGNSGKYMCPFTSDNTVAEWVDKGVAARFGSAVGGTVGAYAGSQALKQVPFIGGMLGDAAGKSIGRKIAIDSAGGWDYIKSTSDLSFNSVDDLAVYIYARHSSRKDYNNVFKLTSEIYPDLQKRYLKAIQNARR